jgi:hypothetical protein
MSSVFDLPTSPSELKSSNAGVDKAMYLQVAADRDSTGTNFANGVIRFPFSVSSNQRFLPSRSYFRIRLGLTDDGGAPLDLNDDVALSMNPASCLWSQGEVRLNNTTVSRCSDYWSQIDNLEKRKDKSNSWFDTVGNSVEVLQPKQQERANLTASDGLLPDGAPRASPLSALGIAAPNQVAYTAASGVLTFTQNGGPVIPDLSQLFPAGSKIRFTADAPAGFTAGDYEVLASGAATVNIAPVSVAAGDVAAINVTDGILSVQAVQADRRISNIELCYQPHPLSLFKCERALPLGQWEVQMTPSQDSVWKKRIIESLIGDKASGVDYNVEVQQIYFYAAMVETSRVDNLTYLIDLENTRCMTDKVTNNGLTQETFNVSPTTYALTVAYQDQRAGNQTNISQPKFKSYQDLQADIPPANSDIPLADQATQLTRWYMQYGGQKYPQVDWDAEFTGDTDHLTQLYMNTQLQCGGYMDSGGAEPFSEWIDRGAYYHFLTPRDGSSVDTRVVVNQQFVSGTTQVQNMQCLLFDHSRAAIQVTIKDGRVQNVQEYNI